MNVELIIEDGPRGRIEYAGFVISETDERVALVSYIAPGKRLPPAVTISKSRIAERFVMEQQNGVSHAKEEKHPRRRRQAAKLTDTDGETKLQEVGA